MPPALPPWPAPDAPAAAPAPTTRAPAAPPSRAGPPPRRAPAPPPSTPRPCDWSTARRPPAAPPAGAAACRAAPASGSSLSSRCAVAGRRARPDRRRCTAPAASRPTAPRTRSSRPPRPSRDPSPAARSPGRAGPSGCPPRRGTAPPAPPRSNAPPPPPRIRLPQAKAPGYRLRHPAGTITEHISRKPYELEEDEYDEIRSLDTRRLGSDRRVGRKPGFGGDDVLQGRPQRRVRGPSDDKRGNREHHRDLRHGEQEALLEGHRVWSERECHGGSLPWSGRAGQERGRAGCCPWGQDRPLRGIGHAHR